MPAPGVSSSDRKAQDAAREKKAKEAKAKADARAAKKKEYMSKAAADTVEEMVEPGELERKWFKEGEWRPEWAPVEFVSRAFPKSRC